MVHEIPQNLVTPFVVVPIDGSGRARNSISSVGRLLLQSLNQLACSLAGSAPSFLAYDPTKRRLFNIPAPPDFQQSGQDIPSSSVVELTQPWYRRFTAEVLARCKTPVWPGPPQIEPGSEMVWVFMSASFLISEQAPFGALVQSARIKGDSCCGNPSTGDLYAFAIRLDRKDKDRLHRLLQWLTVATVNEEQALHQRGDTIDLHMACPGPWNSPAMGKVSNWQGFRPNDAPPFLNRALEETCFNYGLAESKIEMGESIAADLVELRSRSKVPWIFNELLNELEYRNGAVRPASFPVELHLSSTARCNIQCRFCNRMAKDGPDDFLGVDDVRRLDLLGWLRTLRLSSGTGEPTLNRNLPAIIEWVHRKYPHINQNFFTNGIFLDQNELMGSMINGRVAWINVSINAARRETWRILCQADHFDRICQNLRRLLELKQQMRIGNPIIHGSMVLTSESIEDLPRMPALCRELGIDRFVAIPFFALGHGRSDTYTEDHAYHHAEKIYDKVFHNAVEQAESNGITIELPPPSTQKKSGFAVESRKLYDFAGIERHEWQLGKLLCGHDFSHPEGSYCHFLWRYAAVTAAPIGPAGAVERWLYPCLGPLAPIVMAKKLPFRFPGNAEFGRLWQGDFYTLLREAQHRTGVCTICDACRNCDTRQPDKVKEMEKSVAQFAELHGL